MIDFKTLDKGVTYLGLHYGTSPISRKITELTRCYAPEAEKIPSHVLALAHRFDEWWILESHSDPVKEFVLPSGTRHYTQDVWEKIETKSLKNFYAVPMDFDLRALEKLIGQPYGLGDIAALAKVTLLHRNGTQKDRKGQICSEYLARCQKRAPGVPLITEHFNLPAHCITPAHWQAFVDVFDKLIVEKMKKAGVCG